MGDESLYSGLRTPTYAPPLACVKLSERIPPYFAKLPHDLRAMALLNSLKRFRRYCLTYAISRTMIGPCYTPLSLVPKDAPRRCARMK